MKTIPGLYLHGYDCKLPTKREVYYGEDHIGTVTPQRAGTETTWLAEDVKGRCHGGMWPTKWDAAEALYHCTQVDLDDPREYIDRDEGRE